MEERTDDGTHTTARSAPRQRHAVRWTVLAVLLTVIGAVIWTAFWFLGQMNPGNPGAAMTVHVPTGTDKARLAGLLAANGVVGSARAFDWYTGLRPLGAIRAGDYDLRRRESFDGVVETIRTGPKIVEYRLVVPEGFTMQQIAARVQKVVPGVTAADFVSLATNGSVRSVFEPPTTNNLEGFLYPDTYVFKKGVTAIQIVQRMVESFDAQAGAAGIDQLPGYPPYQVLIVASMVQKEGRLPDDLPKIAQVMYNRLARGMPLQVDAALVYNQPAGTKVDTKLDTPYNIYIHKGLPPTPICNPGAAAIKAAAHPTAGPWLYYLLVDKNGQTGFAENYQQFLQMKKDAKARGVF